MATFTFGGLTGFDFGALADAMQQLARAPVDTLQQRQELISSKKDMYKEIQSSLKSLRSAVASLGNPSGLKFAAASSSNASLLTASAASTAALGTYQVTVQQLATSSRATSGFATQLGIAANAQVSQTVNSAAANLGVAVTGGYFTINGTRVDVNVDPDDPDNPATNDTLAQVIQRINDNVTGVTAAYNATTDKLELTSASAITVGSPDDTSNLLSVTGLLSSPDEMVGPDHVRTSTHRLGRIGTSAALDQSTFGTALTGSGSFKINGVEITYDAATESLNAIVSKINTKVSTVVASYDAQTDKIVLSSKSTGSLGITREDVTGNFLAATGLLDNSGESQAAVSLGQNAKLTIPGFNNGNPIYSTSNTVSDAIPGVTLSLKQADAGTTVDVVVSRDSTELQSRIQDFVNKYNDLAGLLHTRLTEEPVRNASTVTTRRIGLLRSDQLLAQIKTGLSQSLLDIVGSLPSDYNRAGNLGISINSADVSTGTLSFDANKLGDALNANFEQAYDVLFADDNGNGTVDTGETGLVPRLLSSIDSLIDDSTQTYNGTSVPLGSLGRRMWSLDQEYSNYTTRISDLEDRLALQDKVVRARFFAAEQAIQQLQSVQNGLSAYTQSAFYGRG